ncbi:TetR/AcrR family transcriptional regulator [Cytobacillus sp. Hz8]|uniref:TetR/AcrR family transcriptional regulator n=1 Tax=Cytobacillus sp. Hz8 TaxID=3347168 RepID=UPI0035E04504
MPRGFNEQEKARIKQILLEEGKILFSRFGLKKTSINELAKAASIAPGSFYTFYQSKEELFFEIMEKEEEIIKSQFLDFDMTKEHDPKQAMKDLLLQAFANLERNTLFSQLFLENNYEAILRKLPQEKLESHFKLDSNAADLIVNKWKEKGLIREIDSEVLAGLFRALFTISLHKEEIGEEVYPQTLELLVHFIVEGLANNEGDE